MLDHDYATLDIFPQNDNHFPQSAIFLKSATLVKFLRMESLKVYLNYWASIKHQLLQLHLGSNEVRRQSFKLKWYLFPIAFHWSIPNIFTFSHSFSLLSRRVGWCWWHEWLLWEMKGKSPSPKQFTFSTFFPLSVSLDHEEAQIFIYSPLESKSFHLCLVQRK